MMLSINRIADVDFYAIPEDGFWNECTNKEDRMHRIHAYPAKFPAFITTKALSFAKKKNVKVSHIADSFCGCGTVAYEAKRNGIRFWGCDINPVATLIAKAKSNCYAQDKLEFYYEKIFNDFKKKKHKNLDYPLNERLNYWYSRKQYNDLLHLKNAIYDNIPCNSKYRLFFLCSFSNILKPASKWLTKSIKPQIDVLKKPAPVIEIFNAQCRFMMSANSESNIKSNVVSKIVTANFLNDEIDLPKVDMIVTSPPYVTSYEYADLHQLSTLWLGYASDYRKYREGSIGSTYHVYDFDEELKGLNKSGYEIITALTEKQKTKAHSVAKYFLDMQDVAKKCWRMLVPGGLAVFVIGNTEYKGVAINNVKHLAESLRDSGFVKLYVTKRKVGRKILTPYRDKLGRFSRDSKSRRVYGEEFILIGMK